MAKKYKVSPVAQGRELKEIAGIQVTVREGKFAVYRAPYDDLLRLDPVAWGKWAEKLAKLWPKEETGLQLIVMPPGAELDVMEIVEDDGQ